MKDGAWCGFKYFAFDGSESEITVTVRGSAMGMLKVYNEREQAPVAEIRVTASQDYTAFSSTFSVSAGTQPLFFVFEGSGAMDFACFEIVYD